MNHTPGGEFIIPLEEPERFLRKQLRKKSRKVAKIIEEDSSMAGQEDERTISDYAKPTLDGLTSSIIRPTIEANNFEIKHHIIQLLQTNNTFSGSPEEDPNSHLEDFLEICDIFKVNGVSNDAIRLRLFPFSLRDRAKAWLHSLPPGSITTWADLA